MKRYLEPGELVTQFLVVDSNAPDNFVLGEIAFTGVTRNKELEEIHYDPETKRMYYNTGEFDPKKATLNELSSHITNNIKAQTAENMELYMSKNPTRVDIETFARACPFAYGYFTRCDHTIEVEVPDGTRVYTTGAFLVYDKGNARWTIDSIEEDTYWRDNTITWTFRDNICYYQADVMDIAKLGVFTHPEEDSNTQEEE